MSELPNLLILGAAKSGTSSLYRYLAQHPDIFMSPIKEPTFFVWEGREFAVPGRRVERLASRMVKDLDSYLELFSGARDERIRGEASTGYLHTPGVPERVKRLLGDVKLMAILRNPVDRAYSAFLHARRRGFEPITDFERALDAEPERARNGWLGLTLYATVGMYAEQLERYLSVFPSSQMRIYLYDDLARDPRAIASDAYRFLRVEDRFSPNIATRHNAGSVVRSPLLHRLVDASRTSALAQCIASHRSARRIYRLVNERPKSSLPPPLRRKLAEVFSADVSQLSRQLRRDLSPWLEGEALAPPGERDEVGIHPRPSTSLESFEIPSPPTSDGPSSPRPRGAR